MSGHDAALLARARTALDAWEVRGGGPTSSLTGGGAIAALERRLAAACGVRHALALPSGTLALRVAMEAVGVDAGSEVVVPALDWPAAAAAARSLGARAVAADTAPGSLLVDPAAVAARIGARTRAVVATHVAGMPADVAALRALCDPLGIAVLEDGSQALGAATPGGPVGGLGTAGVISLGPGKLVDAGEGGVLVTDDEALHRVAVAASQHPVRQLRSGIRRPQAQALAARLHPLAAILRLAGLDDMPAELARRRAAADEVRRLVGDVVPREAAGYRFSWSCVPALLEPAELAAVAVAGVATMPLGATPLGEEPNARHAAACAYALHRL
jgi:dTDP-4-amino-4,6-dideoxygalactose transaminase